MGPLKDEWEPPGALPFYPEARRAFNDLCAGSSCLDAAGQGPSHFFMDAERAAGRQRGGGQGDTCAKGALLKPRACGDARGRESIASSWVPRLQQELWHLQVRAFFFATFLMVMCSPPYSSNSYLLYFITTAMPSSNASPDLPGHQPFETWEQTPRVNRASVRSERSSPVRTICLLHGLCPAAARSMVSWY